MREAVRERWLAEHGCELPADRLATLALTGDGRMQERADSYVEQLLQTPEQLALLEWATTIYWVAHSQGVPVSFLTLHKLLDGGHLRMKGQRVVMLCMAGIMHGPVPAIKGNLVIQYFEAEAARELFALCDGGHVYAAAAELDGELEEQEEPADGDGETPSQRDANDKALNKSRSERYRALILSVWAAVDRCLSSGVRVLAVGSWMDPVVPVYSMTFGYCVCGAHPAHMPIVVLGADGGVRAPGYHPPSVH